MISTNEELLTYLNFLHHLVLAAIRLNELEIVSRDTIASLLLALNDYIIEIENKLID